MFSLAGRIPVVAALIEHWKNFSRFIGSRLYVFIFLSLLATLVESIGIGLFFPLLNAIQGKSSLGTHLEQKTEQIFLAIGLEYTLGSFLVGILFLFALKAAVKFLAGIYQAKVVSLYLSSLSKHTFSAISEQRYDQFLTRNIGVLSNISVNETHRAMVALGKFASIFPSLIAVFVFAGLAVRLDWKLTSATLFFGVLVLSFTRYIARLARKFSHENTDHFGRLNELVLQSFGSFKYLRSTMGIDKLRKQVDPAIDRLAHTQFQLSSAATLSQSINEPVVILFMVVMVWHQSIILGNPLSQVVVLALFFFRLIKEFMILQSCWHDFSSTMGSIGILNKVISESEQHKELFSGLDFKSIDRAISFENVTFSYGNRIALSSINLEIGKNSFVAIVGESGAGKSTLVDLLTGLQKPSSGRLLVDGVPYSKIDLSGFRKKVGYVTQEPVLFNDTIENNISFWDSGDPKEVAARVRDASKSANCLSFIEMLPLGFQTILGDRGVNLSGGQRQRVAIARELYKNPELLILDEATSALDGEAELEVQNSLESLRGKVTVVVIAHRLSTIRAADQINVFSEGKLIESGSFQALFDKKDSNFRRFCDLQGVTSN